MVVEYHDIRVALNDPWIKEAINAVKQGFPDLMIIGPMGAGKTTGAKLLAEEFGYLHLPIAGDHPGGIRDIAVRLWGQEAHDDREKLNGLAVIDDQFPGVWVKSWERHVQDMEQHHRPPIVVDDVRRTLEYDVLRARGFVCVRVVANEHDRVDRLKISGKWQNEEQLTGRWEQWWPTARADYELTNDGTIDDYYNDLVDILVRERKRR